MRKSGALCGDLARLFPLDELGGLPLLKGLVTLSAVWIANQGAEQA